MILSTNLEDLFCLKNKSSYEESMQMAVKHVCDFLIDRKKPLNTITYDDLKKPLMK